MVLIGGLLCSGPLSAAEPYVPDALKPWKEWVLHGKPELICPQEQAKGRRLCAWPSAIDLDLSQQGGRFVQTWHMLAPGYVRLPGDVKLAALDVQVDGARAVVIGQPGSHRVWLQSGVHKISGTFSWDRMPSSVVIPGDSAVVSLRIEGRKISQPKLDGATLFLQVADDQSLVSSDALELRVHRKVVDDIPLKMETQFDLTVSGKNREIVLQNWHPAGFILMNITSALPVRMGGKGELIIQARPGKWNVLIGTRATKPLPEIVRQPVVPPLPDDEIWVFAASEQLRLVNVEGVVTIDSSQTLVPDAWKGLPAYAVGPDSKFILNETKRGNPVPAPDQISLVRTMWLDFDGNGYTVKDVLTGEVKQSWRLEMPAPSVLGKVTVNNDNLLITRGESGDAGVELTQGRLSMQADSRIPHPVRSLPATGWKVDLQSLAVNLQLPPAWRVFHASGTDATQGTWVRTWDLLHLFVLLVTAIAIARLSGLVWGVIAFVALVLILPEGIDAPKYIWLAALPVLALSTLTIPKPFDRLFSLYKWVVGITLIFICADFSLSQVRRSMYPVLEQPWAQLGSDDGRGYDDQLMPEGGAADVASEAVSGYVEEESSLDVLSRNVQVKKAEPMQQQRRDKKQMLNMVQYDPKANIQTGPGLPQWSWQSVKLTWNGPVQAGQKVGLILMPPWINRSLGFLRAILALALVALILTGGRYEFGGISTRRLFRRWLPAAAVVLSVLHPAPPRSVAADFPSPELLNTLEARLTATPDCSPDCYAVGRMQLSIEQEQLVIRMEAQAEATVVLPLPGDANHWLPQEVVIDGAAAALTRVGGGSFQTVISRGVHQIVLRGRLPDRDSVQIVLPVTPAFAAYSGSGWSADGIHENGRTDGTISLIRNSGEKKTSGAEASGEDLAGTLPAFVRIDRSLSIGLDWLVTTTVTRLAGSGSAVNLKIPLLAGEQVTSADVRVADQFAAVTMGPSVNEVSWESIVTPAENLVLTAADNSLWIEWWTLEHSPIWHVEYAGIPVIDHSDESGARRPHWRPWPGETVTLSISRPAAVEGATATVDRAVLEATPGERSTEAVLNLVVRASIGSDLPITLPAGADFQSVAIDGKAGIIRPVDNKLIIPLKPGRQEIRTVWRQNSGIGFVYRTPQVNIGLPGVNYSTKVNMPRDRWTLWFRGPGTGPAILFWSRLFIVILIGFALGRIPMSPLRSWQWILLGIGLTQTKLVGAFLVAGFFLAVHFRAKKPTLASAFWFNVRQFVLIGWCGAAVLTLLHALKTGFFGVPQMQIVGNGSGYRSLQWFIDRYEPMLPSATVFSIPMFVYQVIMLSWALWLAFSVVKWSQWIWQAMGEGGWYRKLDPIVIPKRKSAAADQPAEEEKDP
jgi:hypothetical protein